ncbi:MAG: penicillin-binding transpeptidase domain-containing protein [Planctomycetaceae bacterium]
MLNQPRHTAFDMPDSGTIGPGSVSRFRFLATAFVAAAVVVLVRIGYVQSRLQQSYLQSLEITTTEYEVLPARDGRILTDNDVLAADVDQYAVEVHYRWLQEPVDDAWLRRQVRAQLTSDERRDEKLVADTQAAILQARGNLWQAMSAVCSLPDSELCRRRETIQQTVTRIADSVNRRRFSHDVLSDDDLLKPDTGDDGPLMSFASAVRRALTEPPTRSEADRIVVREEEDFHVVVPDVPLAVAAEIREHPERFPGVRIAAGTQRTYPHTQFAPHVVGARTPLTDDELAKSETPAGALRLANWRPKTGRFGVELSANRHLSGTPGLRKIVRNRRQEIVESTEVRKPIAGRDIVLTLSVPLQQHAERLLQEALAERPPELLLSDSNDDPDKSEPQTIPVGASVVVMDVQSGRLLAAASAPKFALSLYVSGSQRDWDAANADTRRPFVSRVTSMALPPGSVFKPVTAAAGMESGVLDPDATFFCRGYLSNPDEHRCLIFRLYGSGHGNLTLRRALSESCNVYFFSVAQKTGIAPLVDWSERFEFGRPTGVDLPFEKKGTLPSSERTIGAAQSGRRGLEREALGLAIGQSQLTATPLQMVRMMAAIANGGWLVTPHVVSQDGVARTAGDISDAPHPNPRRRIPGLQVSTLERIREGLTAAVQEPSGTAFRTVRLPVVAIAGKTGTAETTPGKPDHAWFAGYVPADRPQFAFVVVLEHGGSGGRTAGPVARELVRRMLELSLL